MDLILVMASSAGAFRFVFQPLMAGYRGVRDGRTDRSDNQRPFVERILFQSNRCTLAFDALKSIWPVTLLALVLDIYYQYQLFGQVNLAITLLICFLLAILPYSLGRGLSNRWSRAGLQPALQDRAVGP